MTSMYTENDLQAELTLDVREFQHSACTLRKFIQNGDKTTGHCDQLLRTQNN